MQPVSSSVKTAVVLPAQTSAPAPRPSRENPHCQVSFSVIAPDGTLVEQVPTGDRVTTNIAFGGPELKTAYITLSGRGELIAMDWSRPGLPLNFLNK